ncbi:MAG: serine/threonine-protein kinase [Polyangiaceae bacterium]
MLADPEDARTTQPLPTRTAAVAGAPAPKILDIGSVLSKTYRVVRPLAEGAMGAVYEAEHLRLGRRVAIKVLRDEFRRHPEALLRFRREAETVGRLQNPHIVQVFDVDETDAGDPYFVMEFLQGESLAERLQRQKRIAMAEALAIASQVASALASAHAQGVVHRDLKPDNIFLVLVPDQPPFVKILDFGIATAQDGQKRVTNENTVMGTAEYMAPEQATGDRDIDHRADQFALAVVLYEMAAGAPPFGGSDPMAVLYQVVHEACKPLHSVAPWVPVVFDDVLARAMAKKRDERFASISQFAWALENAARHVGVSETLESIPQARGRYRRATPPGAERYTPPGTPKALQRADEDDSHLRYRERAERLFSDATTAYKAGRLDDAVFAAEHLFDLALHHRDAETYEMMAKMVPALDRIFERRLGTMDTLLVCTKTDPKRLNLTPRAATLLEHVDGGNTVGHVLSVCGIPRRDAIRMLAGLLRRGALTTALRG